MSKLKLFISYAHADMEPAPGFEESRVGHILRDIKHELHCHSSRSRYEILRDVEGLIQVGDCIDDPIEEAIENCDIAIVLLSEAYCVSEECEKEFVGLLRTGKPLFLIETQDLWSDQSHRLHAYRADVERRLSARFWGTVNQRNIRYGWPMPGADRENQDKYYDALRQVVLSLKDKTRELLNRPLPEHPAPGGPTEPAMVFLAHPTADVKPELDRLHTVLEDEKFSVIRFDPRLDNENDAETDRFLSQHIGESTLFVQLLGALPGRQMGSKPLVIEQNEIASRLTGEMHVWRSPAFDPTECGPEYGSFLNSTPCHISSYEDFEQYVLKKAREARTALESARQRQARIEEQGANMAEDETLPLVAIDVAPDDVPLAETMMDALSEFVCVASLPDDVDHAMIKEAVAVNDGIVLIHGPSKEGQIRAGAHFGFIRRASRRLKNRLVELAIGKHVPPEKPIMPHPRGPNIHVIEVDDDMRTVDQESMFKFLEQVRESARLRPDTGTVG